MMPYDRLMPDTTLVVFYKELIDIDVFNGYERYIELADQYFKV